MNRTPPEMVAFISFMIPEPTPVSATSTLPCLKAFQPSRNNTTGTRSTSS